MSRSFVCTFAMLAGLGTALTPAPAAAQEVTLTVHHFLPPTSPTQADFIEPWAERIEQQSDGRITVEIFPAMSMGGRPSELYGQVRDGLADIVWTLIGYTPGVFPRSEVFELPSVHRSGALATNLAIQDLYADYLAKDFAEVKPLLVHVHAGNALHMVDTEVRDLAALDGVKLRTPSRTGAWLIEAWQGEPVGMPVPELPQALSRQVVAGALIPFEVALPLKVQELTDYAVEGHEGERFGTSVFLYAMNQERYDSLPDDLKQVIDDNAMANLAEFAGTAWDNVEARAMDVVRQASTVIQLDRQAQAAFDAAAEPVVARWIEDSTAQGLDGQALLEAARAAVAGHSQ